MTNEDKIRDYVLAFESGPEEKWARYESRQKTEDITWAQFKEFMLDSIKDKRNREFDAAN